MAYAKYIARMTLRSSDTSDTFPERHVLDTPPESSVHPEVVSRDDTPDDKAKPIRRRPRRRSESIDGYEMRDRYWEAMDIIDRDLREAAKAPAVWDYVYDPICLPPSGSARTPAIRQLGGLSIRRAWRRRNSREKPDASSARTVEAIMLYERGMMLSQQSRCTYCQRGQGISPGCVVMDAEWEPREPRDPSIAGGTVELKSTCSNCLYAGRTEECRTQLPSPAPSQPSRTNTPTPNHPSRTHTPSQMRRSFASTPDHLEVLDLVEKTLRAKRGNGGNDGLSRARQIELAALEIAQAAHEWGLGGGEKRRKNIDPVGDSTD
ncbi:uncharacterized protein GGS25DRAFT_497276 [Hypoxylon fragiforme]|uniref:uncharacterized protein n=1 Tax=Hypoxylon fragiforme TaxID=63214 RepID=UPI0020C68F5B|nr:uncharacterized protein GGS25DRAFT_497276 [Hypoxylon fragiforme]KAI2607747.1 hypothetical protein GGS25DRAFT_497276 [Hypoxylon fragiforme]